MSVDPRCGNAILAAGELDTIARQLHGKAFRQLSDDEASLVWDAIDAIRKDAQP